MTMKTTYVAGEPLPAADMNSIVQATLDNSHNIIELFLQNYFDSKATPYAGLFFDGFSDNAKVGSLGGDVGVDAANKKLYFGVPNYGRGTDGDLTVTGTTKVDGIKKGISSQANSGQKDVIVSDGSVFTAGKLVLIIQIQGTGAGNYEYGQIDTIATNTLTLKNNLVNTYQSTKAQVIQLKEYNNVTIQSGGILTADAWNRTIGGIVAFCAMGAVDVQSGGKIEASGLGHWGGEGVTYTYGSERYGGFQGDSELGIGVWNTQLANGSGGGGSNSIVEPNGALTYATGGGGGHATSGTQGELAYRTGGAGGGTIGQTNLATIFFGGGGGGPAGYRDSGLLPGGNGGGIIIILAASLNVSGNIYAKGDDSEVAEFPDATGGGGAGGSILLLIGSSVLGTGLVLATGGIGGDANYDGGDGGDGRIAIASDKTSASGTTSPTYGTGGTIAGRFVGLVSESLSGYYTSVLTAFQQSMAGVRLWVVRNFTARYNLAALINIGATTLTITGDQTGKFANGDIVDIYTANFLTRERKTLTAAPTYGSGVTTLTFGATANGYGTTAYVERVDVKPQVSLVDQGGADSFQDMTYKKSIVDSVNSEVEDEYEYIAGTAQEDFKVKLNLSRNDVTLGVYAKRLGASLNI